MEAWPSLGSRRSGVGFTHPRPVKPLTIKKPAGWIETTGLMGVRPSTVLDPQPTAVLKLRPGGSDEKPLPLAGGVPLGRTRELLDISGGAGTVGGMPTQPRRNGTSRTDQHGAPMLQVLGLLDRVAKMSEDEALQMLSTPCYDMAPLLLEACCNRKPKSGQSPNVGRQQGD